MDTQQNKTMQEMDTQENSALDTQAQGNTEETPRRRRRKTDGVRFHVSGKTLLLGVVEPILDKGYARLVDYMGGELGVVNAARASFARESQTLNKADIKLLRYLYEHKHLSPFRHALFTFEVKAPLMVCRQWWKYVVGSDHTMDAWNEQSKRYVIDADKIEFYLPSLFRVQAEDKKQGSSDLVLEGEQAEEAKEALLRLYAASLVAYDRLRSLGVSGELSRGALPANMQYTTWRWTASLQSVLHFLVERLDDHAQWEIRQYAEAVYELIAPIIPNVLELIPLPDKE